MQSSVLEAAAADGVGLVISVDTGMRAFAEAAARNASASTSSSPTIISPTPAMKFPSRSPSSIPTSLAALSRKISLRRSHRLQTGQPSCSARDPVPPHPRKDPSLLLENGRHRHRRRRRAARGENRVLPPSASANLHRPAGLGLRALFQAAGIDPATTSAHQLRPRLPPRLRASTPPAAWILPPKSSSSSPPATAPAPPSSPRNSNASTPSAAKPKPRCCADRTRLATDTELAPTKDGRHGRRRLASRHHRHSRLAHRRPHRQARHRRQHRRRRRLRLRPLYRRLPSARSHRDLRRSLHPLRRPRLRRRLRHAR
jgi:hypothetical protein